ncbi:MAG TPA: hypothetical protein VGL80_07400 [Pseudonocardiaceae bacterium]
MDEQRLSELFQAAAGDGPPASFDEKDVAAAARKVTARRRSMLAGGGGLFVVILAVGLLFGTGAFGHTLRGGTASSAGALAAPPQSVTSRGTFGHALAGPDVGTAHNFPSSTPMQGGGAAGRVGPAAGSTRAGCGPTDGQLAVALANELPSVGAPTANPATLACVQGSRSVSYLVGDGYVIAVLVPAASNGLYSDTAAGSHSFRGPTASGRWILVVLSQPAAGGTVGPLVGQLGTIQRAVAAQF